MYRDFKCIDKLDQQSGFTTGVCYLNKPLCFICTLDVLLRYFLTKRSPRYFLYAARHASNKAPGTSIVPHYYTHLLHKEQGRLPQEVSGTLLVPQNLNQLNMNFGGALIIPQSLQKNTQTNTRGLHLYLQFKCESQVKKYQLTNQNGLFWLHYLNDNNFQSAVKINGWMLKTKGLLCFYLYA